MIWDSACKPKLSSGVTIEDIRNRQIYCRALIVCAIISFLHMISLPFVVSWDGYVYIDLADMLGHTRAATDWDYLRPPLFPLLLKLIFKLTGRQALSVIFLNTSFGFLGAWLTGSTIKRLGHPLAAAGAALLICFYPTLAAYEHCMLSETGTFFFLALIMRLLAWNEGVHYLSKTAALIATLTVGYYYRPTLLYLSPVAAAIYGFSLWREGTPLLNSRSARFWIMLASITIVPFIGAYPWSSLPQVKQRMGAQFYYGASKQALLAPDDPALGPLKDYYEDSVHIALQDNHINVSGLINGREHTLFAQMNIAFANQSGSRVFLGMIRRNPRRYVAGVLRSTLLFCGYPGLESDNKMFTTLVIDNITGAQFFAGPPDLKPKIESSFAQKTGPFSITCWLFRMLVPLYTYLILIAWAVTFIALPLGLWQRNWKVVLLTAIPTAFLVMHALVLMSVDRLVLPAYPLVLANLVVIPVWLKGHYFRRSRPVTVMPA